MSRYHVLPLPELAQCEPESLRSLNDAGDLLIDGGIGVANAAEKGIAGVRYHAPTGRRVTLSCRLAREMLGLSVTAMNGRGEVVGGYRGMTATEGRFGVFWDARGRGRGLAGGFGVAINDARQVLVDGTHVTDGSSFGSYAVVLAPGGRGPTGTLLALGMTAQQAYNSPAFATGINRQGAVVSPGMYLWEPGQYQSGRCVEVSSAANRGTTFGDGASPVITDNGLIVGLGRTVPNAPPKTLRFHCWKRAASTTTFPLRLPTNSIFYGSEYDCNLTSIAANGRGEILLSLKETRLETLLWRDGVGITVLPQITRAYLLNNQGWVLGELPRVSIRGPRRYNYALLRPY